MNFDFYALYKDYSNLELLIIVKGPDEYQPAAINAATQILKEREVSEADVMEAEHYYARIDKTEQEREEKISAYKEQTADFLEPVLQPGKEVMPGKWINIFLLVLGLQYAWSLYNTIIYFIEFFECYDCHFGIFYFFRFLSILYVPFVFFLLLKRNRWGWMLLFADNLFSLISLVSQAFILFTYREFYQNGTSAFLFQLIVKGLFVYFLWKPAITDFFGVSKANKEKTAIVTVIASAIFIFGVQFFA